MISTIFEIQLLTNKSRLAINLHYFGYVSATFSYISAIFGYVSAISGYISAIFPNQFPLAYHINSTCFAIFKLSFCSNAINFGYFLSQLKHTSRAPPINYF